MFSFLCCTLHLLALERHEGLIRVVQRLQLTSKHSTQLIKYKRVVHVVTRLQLTSKHSKQLIKYKRDCTRCTAPTADL